MRTCVRAYMYYVCMYLSIVTESHVAAYSALAERQHLCHERCRVVIASVEDGQRDTHIHVSYSIGSREYRERTRVEEGVACTGESRYPERGRESSAERI